MLGRLSVHTARTGNGNHGSDSRLSRTHLTSALVQLSVPRLTNIPSRTQLKLANTVVTDGICVGEVRRDGTIIYHLPNAHLTDSELPWASHLPTGPGYIKRRQVVSHTLTLCANTRPPLPPSHSPHGIRSPSRYPRHPFWTGVIEGTSYTLHVLCSRQTRSCLLGSGRETLSRYLVRCQH
jgi:hypothetical protein